MVGWVMNLSCRLLDPEPRARRPSGERDCCRTASSAGLTCCPIPASKMWILPAPPPDGHGTGAIPTLCAWWTALHLTRPAIAPHHQRHRFRRSCLWHALWLAQPVRCHRASARPAGARNCSHRPRSRLRMPGASDLTHALIVQALPSEGAHRLRQPEHAIDMSAESGAVGDEERLPAAMRSRAVHHARGVGIAPVPSPSGGAPAESTFSKPGLGSRLGPQ